MARSFVDVARLKECRLVMSQALWMPCQCVIGQWKWRRSFSTLVVLPYNGNCPQKKKFANFANLEAFANVSCSFYLGRNFYI